MKFFMWIRHYEISYERKGGILKLQTGGFDIILFVCCCFFSADMCGLRGDASFSSVVFSQS